MSKGSEIAKAVGGYLSEKWRGIAVFVSLVVILALPFLLRPPDQVTMADADGEVIIISPHNETIRSEFSRAFAKHMKATTGKNIRIDWRTPGGTSEVVKVIDSKFKSAKKELEGIVLTDEEIALEMHNWQNFAPPSVEEIGDLPRDERDSINEKLVFLRSDVGIGIDLFFGGGAYPFMKQAEKGQLVAGDAEQGIGIAGIAEKHPNWLSNEIIPASAGGELYVDGQMCWVGTNLSAFGIVYNRDVLQRLNIESEPTGWEDLANPAFFKQIALADPSKSGSATKAFEMLIQQQMHIALARLEQEKPDEELSVLEDRAVREGWANGMGLILKIGANARYFTGSSEKIPDDVASGNAAAGMCLDAYGRIYVHMLGNLKPGRTPRVGYITPEGGSSVGADPMGMFRGAPNPELATAFMEFVLSKEGQGIWGFREQVPGGPERQALHRLPIRKDMYVGDEVDLMVDPNARPYEDSAKFTYRSDWTGKTFSVIQFIVRAMCIDSHDELAEAWQAVYSNDFPPQATKTLLDFNVVSYDSSVGPILEVINSKDPDRQARLAKEMRDLFKSNYAKAAAHARKGN